MEVVLQACVCGLRFPTRHPGQGRHQSPPAVHLLPQTAILHCLGPHKAPKVVAYRNYLEAVAPEDRLCQRDVPGIHDQDAHGRLQGVTLQGPYHHQVIQVSPDPIKGAARSSFICISGLYDNGVGLPQFTDEREDSQPIRHHCQWVFRGHSLLAENKGPFPSPAQIAIVAQCW